MSKFDLKSLNATINRYLSPQTAADLNVFIEQMPMRAGYGVLIAGGIVWFIAGLAVVYATTVAKDVAEIRAELIKSEALKPVVATLVQTPVADDQITNFIDRIKPLYKDVTITSTNGGTISINATSGRFFGAFREAINHSYNGGHNWRLSLQTLCVGRECTGGFLQGTFKVNTLKVQR